MESMAEPSLNEILEFALALSREAGQFILPRWKNVAVEHKADGSEVTEADRGAEQLLRCRIGERYPGHRRRSIASDNPDKAFYRPMARRLRHKAK